MSAAPEPSSTPARRFPTRFRWRWLLVLTLVLALAGGAWLWFASLPPTPPDPDLAGADPEAVAAIAAARAAALQSPRSAAAWGRLGMVLRAHDFGPDANRCFAVAERLDPRQPRWPYLHGLTLLLTDPEAGIPRLQRAVDLCGDRPLAPRLRLAETLLARGRLDEAERHLRQALQREPDNPRVHLGLARLALHREQPAVAAEHLAAVGDNPLSLKAARILRLEAERLAGRPVAAAAARAAAALPDDPPWPDPFVEEVEALQVGLQARLARADVLLRQGRAEEALAVLGETAARYPESARPRLALGQALIQTRHPEAAERELRRATELEPELVEAWFDLGVALSLQEKAGAAAECFRRTVRLKPDHGLAHYNLGQCLKVLGDRAGAVQAFGAAVRARPDYEPALRELRALQPP
jgi:tetratricopeptide (TPR) repeat protein